MTRLIIHIGTHKTGTSSFQQFMADTRHLYRAEGINFLLGPSRGQSSPANRSDISNAVLRDRLMTGGRMRGHLKVPDAGERIAVFDRLARQIGDEAAPCHVLSSEGFCFARHEGERRRVAMMLGRTGLRPEIVVTFRNTKDWRESWAAQMRKLDRLRAAGQSVLPHGEGRADIRNDWYFNRTAICRFWRRFGPLHIVDYDRALETHGSILPALLDAMDLPLLANPQDYWKNRRR